VSVWLARLRGSPKRSACVVPVVSSPHPFPFPLSPRSPLAEVGNVGYGLFVAGSFLTSFARQLSADHPDPDLSWACAVTLVALAARVAFAFCTFFFAFLYGNDAALPGVGVPIRNGRSATDELIKERVKFYEWPAAGAAPVAASSSSAAAAGAAEAAPQAPAAAAQEEEDDFDESEFSDASDEGYTDIEAEAEAMVAAETAAAAAAASPDAAPATATAAPSSAAASCACPLLPPCSCRMASAFAVAASTASSRAARVRTWSLRLRTARAALRSKLVEGVRDVRESVHKGLTEVRREVEAGLREVEAGLREVTLGLREVTDETEARAQAAALEAVALADARLERLAPLASHFRAEEDGGGKGAGKGGARKTGGKKEVVEEGDEGEGKTSGGGGCPEQRGGDGGEEEGRLAHRRARRAARRHHHHHHQHQHHHESISSPARGQGAEDGPSAAADEPTCAVCLGALVAGDPVAQLPCSELHVFHAHCILPWLKKSKRCPLCTVDIDEPSKAAV
jgi:hypothetical protein